MWTLSTALLEEAEYEAEQAISQILEWGGATMTHKFEPVTQGWVVAKWLSTEEMFPVSQFTAETLLTYRDSNPEARYLGAWIDNGLCYLDVVNVVTSHEEAIEWAVSNGQKAIYDLSTGETENVEQYVGQTGLLPGLASVPVLWSRNRNSPWQERRDPLHTSGDVRGEAGTSEERGIQNLSSWDKLLLSWLRDLELTSQASQAYQQGGSDGLHEFITRTAHVGFLDYVDLESFGEKLG